MKRRIDPCGRRSWIGALMLAAGATVPASAFPIDIVAIGGQGAPDGNGTYGYCNPPSINSGGRIAFRCFFQNTALGERDNEALVSGVPGSISLIYREGQNPPEGNGMFRGAGHGMVTDSGLVGSHGYLTGTSNGELDDDGLYIGSGGPLTKVVREGELAPDGNGTFGSFDDINMDSAGRLGFAAFLENTANPTHDSSGIFRGTGGVVETLLRAGWPLPVGPGSFRGLSFAEFNTAGEAAARWRLGGTPNGTWDDTGVYRTNGVSIVQIAREGQIAPDLNGQLDDLASLNYWTKIGIGGHVVFECGLLGTSGGLSDNSAIFRGSGGPLTMIARKGQAVPDGNGTYSELHIPAVNAVGEVAFYATLAGTSGGATDDLGLFRGDGGSVTQIAREGTPVPDGNGTYLYPGVDAFTINASGQVAFLSDIGGTSGGTSDDRAIYLYDNDHGVVELVRKGDSLAGSTVVWLYLNGEETLYVGTGLNDSGQVAFNFELADGRFGVGIATFAPPCNADVNCDGAVNGFDVEATEQAVNGDFSNFCLRDADLNGDGAVNGFDIETEEQRVNGAPC